MKCKFYDDGCGNGGYCSSMNVSAPYCNLSKTPLSPKCKGDTHLCEISNTLAEHRSHELNRLEREIKLIKTKV